MTPALTKKKEELMLGLGEQFHFTHGKVERLFEWKSRCENGKRNRALVPFTVHYKRHDTLQCQLIVLFDFTLAVKKL